MAGEIVNWLANQMVPEGGLRIVHPDVLKRMKALEEQQNFQQQLKKAGLDQKPVAPAAPPPVAQPAQPGQLDGRLEAYQAAGQEAFKILGIGAKPKK